jgi:hypothetical protein
VHEPAVTLTDFALTLECGVLAVLIARTHPAPGARRLAWRIVLLFLSVGLAALCGGLVHGFLPDETSAANRGLWAVTLAAIGLSALALWALGAQLLLEPRPARRLEGLALIAWLGYAALVAAGARDFRVAVLGYLPAVAFAIVSTLAGRRWPAAGRRRVLGGLILTLVAAGIQQGRLGLHPIWFDHNALYHAVQALALLMLFLGGRVLVAAGGPSLSHATGGRR